MPSYLSPHAVGVRLTNTVYTTSEAAGSVDICAGVTDGNLRGRNLTVTVTTMDGSATGFMGLYILIYVAQ